MKVIFLDHDGVVCLSPQWGGRFKKQEEWCKKHGPTEDEKMDVEFRFDNFDIKAVKTLNEILEQTGAELVISSDWRNYCTLEEMGNLFQKYGVNKKPVAFTNTRGFGGAMTRANEILSWLQNHPEVTHWVAVDDLKMSKFSVNEGETVENDWGLTNFVHTPKQNEGIKQSGIKEKIINFLS